MRRRQFIKYSLLLSIVIVSFTQMAFSQHSISNEELIGKGTPKLFGEGYLLREEAHLAFLKMKKDALKAGIKIGIVSSYRSYEHQNRIWERKFKRYKSQGFSEENTIKKIIEYSTIPGTSRHHWGTDIDIYDSNTKQPKNVLVPSNYHGNGAFCKLKEWMDLNAKNYGFYIVYSNNANRKGFKYEPWHYSYRPLSVDFLKQYKTLAIKEILKKEKLVGNNSVSESFINNYISENILDINPELL